MLAAVLVTLVVIAVLLCWPLWGFAVMVMVLAWSAPLLGFTDGPQGLLRGLRAWPGYSGVGVAALSLWLLARVVMPGGSRHEAAHRRVWATAGALRGDFTALVALGKSDARGNGRPGLLLTKGLYGYWLRLTLRLTMRRSLHPTPGTSDRRPSAHLPRRLALGLGPPLHWTGVVSSLIVTVVCIAVPLLLNWTSFQSHFARQLGMNLVVGAPIMMLAVPIGWPAGLWATRREQALLRSLPGVPQGAALNHWLAALLARQYLLMVLAVAVACVICIRFFDLDFQWVSVEDWVIGTTALAPFMVLPLWRDWSRLPPPTGGMAALLVGAALGVGGTAWLWVSLLQGHGWGLAGLSALVFAPPGWWRWRLAVRAPVAWPVGRAADVR